MVNACVQPTVVNLYIPQRIHSPAGGHLEHCPFHSGLPWWLRMVKNWPAVQETQVQSLGWDISVVSSALNETMNHVVVESSDKV